MLNLIKKLKLVHSLLKLEDLCIAAITVYIGAAFAIGGIPNRDISRLVLAMLFCVLGLAGINSINQVFDLDIDKINKPHRPLPSGHMSTGQVTSISMGFILAAAFIVPFLGDVFFFIGMAGLGLGMLYNVPFSNVRKNIVTGSVTVAFGYSIMMLLVGWSVFQPLSTLPLWIFLLIFFHDSMIVVGKDMGDYRGDKVRGIRTLPVIFGVRKGAIIALVLYSLSYGILFAWGIVHGGTLLYYSLLVGAVMFGFLIYGPTIWLKNKNFHRIYALVHVELVLFKIGLLALFLGILV